MRLLLAVLALNTLAVAAQPADDSTSVKKNEFSVDLQFLGRGESRYGGMPTEPVDIDEEPEDRRCP